MIRHISMFQMNPHPVNGKTMEENEAALKAFLEKLPEMEPKIVGSKVAVNAGPQPQVPEDAAVAFSQVVQMIDFARPEDAAAYPESEAHMALMKFSEGMVKKVSAIDLEI